MVAMIFSSLTYCVDHWVVYYVLLLFGLFTMAAWRSLGASKQMHRHTVQVIWQLEVPGVSELGSATVASAGFGSGIMASRNYKYLFDIPFFFGLFGRVTLLLPGF